MTTAQVVALLSGLAVILVVSRALGAAAGRFLGQPPVVGEILAGILLGPTLLDGRIADTLFPADIRPMLGALANVGLTLFMFLVGLELDAALIRRRGRALVGVTLGSIAVPMGLGVLLALYLARGREVPDGPGFVLFMGVAMSVTAFPVLARILADRGMSRSPTGALALASAGIGDVVAWTLLAGLAALTGGHGEEPWRVLLVVPFAVLVLAVVRPVLRRLWTAAGPSGGGGGGIALVVATALLSGAATEWMGLHFIFGAFLAGLAVPRDGRPGARDGLAGAGDGPAGAADGLAEARARVEHGVGQICVVLLPVYFVVAGSRVDLSALDVTSLVELALILLVAMGGKFAGVMGGARVHGIGMREATVLATLMNTRGLTELVILGLGLQLGLLDTGLYSLMVAMALITTVLTGPLLRLLGRGDTAVPEPAHSPPVPRPVGELVGKEAG
ncbi:cation:proton antiporter [Streptomyces sp. URMC 123]|uniref:cation:proton antiporter n=1 Tax=Streptomyces sp. URMC 123 TaxID=3423403 RepID=UPI003F1A9C15